MFKIKKIFKRKSHIEYMYFYEAMNSNMQSAIWARNMIEAHKKLNKPLKYIIPARKCKKVLGK